MILAKALLKKRGSSPSQIQSMAKSASLFVESSRKPPKVANCSFDALLVQAHALINQGLPDLSIPKFVWLNGLHEWSKLAFEPAPTLQPWSSDVQRRYIKIFGEKGFAKSCTYKLSGDFVVHCILRAEHIAAWRVCALANNENVYGPVASVHGSISNTVVRQYTDTPPHELLVSKRNMAEHIKFIVVATSILELTSSPITRLLIDRDILRRKSPNVPHLALTNECFDCDGVPMFGYVIDNSFMSYKTAMDAILSFLSKAQEYNVEGIADVYNAMFYPEKLPSTSTLRQYVAE